MSSHVLFESLNRFEGGFFIFYNTIMTSSGKAHIRDLQRRDQARDQACVHSHTHTHTHTYTHIHAHTHAHTNTHIHAHTLTRSQVSKVAMLLLLCGCEHYRWSELWSLGTPERYRGWVNWVNVTLKHCRAGWVGLTRTIYVQYIRYFGMEITSITVITVYMYGSGQPCTGYGNKVKKRS